MSCACELCGAGAVAHCPRRWRCCTACLLVLRAGRASREARRRSRPGRMGGGGSEAAIGHATTRVLARLPAVRLVPRLVRVSWRVLGLI